MTRFRHYPDAEHLASLDDAYFEATRVEIVGQANDSERDAADTGYVMEDGVLRQVSLTEKGSQS